MSQKDQRFRREQMAIFKKACRKGDIKMTPQRLEIFLEVSGSHNHPSAEDVFNAVVERLPTMSLDTVYRTLSTYEQLGLITQINVERGRARFDPNTSHHHHLVCSECKSIADFHWPELDNLPLPPRLCGWGGVELKSVQIVGLCPRCLRNRKNQTTKTDSADRRRLALCT